MNETVKIIECEKRDYQYGPGIKISFETESEKRYHAVFFSNSPLYIVVEDFKAEDICKIKGEVLKSGGENSLISIFDITRIY